MQTNVWYFFPGHVPPMDPKSVIESGESVRCLCCIEGGYPPVFGRYYPGLEDWNLENHGGRMPKVWAFMLVEAPDKKD